MKKEFVSRQQVMLLPERLRKAEETDATKELYFYMWDLFEKKNYEPLNIMVVGSGGSYPAAVFAKHALHDKMRTPNVEAVTPQTAIRIFTQFDLIVNCTWQPQYDLVIGISYSGRTSDIKSVSELCKAKGYPFLLVTGTEKPQLLDLYQEDDSIKIVSYFNKEDSSGKEKGIISMASTLAPAVIFDDNWSCKLISDNQEALLAGEKFVSDLNISEIAKAIKQHPVIHVLYEWDTLPTATDIESKFTKSGIANVILHEKKNFSHERYTALYNQSFALVINLTRHCTAIPLDEGMEIKKFYKYEYDEKLATFLTRICKDKSAQYIEIGSVAITPSYWNIVAMAILPYLITAIGEELDIDISKPKTFPDEAIQLHNYKGKF